MPRSSPRLSGTLFACVILGMKPSLALVVAGGAGPDGVSCRHLLKTGWLSLFWSGWRGKQLIDAAAEHQIGADEAGEGERAFDGVLGRLGQTQEHEGDQRHGDLEAHGVLAGADEVADFQRLLDPAEEQLNAPTSEPLKTQLC